MHQLACKHICWYADWNPCLLRSYSNRHEVSRKRKKQQELLPLNESNKAKKHKEIYKFIFIEIKKKHGESFQPRNIPKEKDKLVALDITWKLKPRSFHYLIVPMSGIKVNSRFR